MEPTQRESSHAAAVDTCLAGSLEHASAVEVAGLFRVAFEAVWNRAVATLGSVTLTAIAECVLVTATDQYEFLSVIDPHAQRASGNTRGKQPAYDRLLSVPRSKLIEGLRFGLIELLTVLGRLTAELLSHELHAALLETTANRAAPAPEPGASPDATRPSVPADRPRRDTASTTKPPPLLPPGPPEVRT